MLVSWPGFWEHDSIQGRKQRNCLNCTHLWCLIHWNEDKVLKLTTSVKNDSMNKWKCLTKSIQKENAL